MIFSCESNGIQYYSTFFVQDEKDILRWACSDNISLQNNDNGVASFGYADTTLTSLTGQGGINLYQ